MALKQVAIVVFDTPMVHRTTFSSDVFNIVEAGSMRSLQALSVGAFDVVNKPRAKNTSLLEASRDLISAIRKKGQAI